MKVEDVTFAAPSGKTAAYLVRPAGKGPFAGALFLHWYDPASQTSNRSESWRRRSPVAEAAPASVFLQFAEADQYVPIYVTDELFEAASEPKRMKLYGGGHELDAAARRDRVAWLRERLGLP